jgi:hypothetical protein
MFAHTNNAYYCSVSQVAFFHLTVSVPTQQCSCSADCTRQRCLCVPTSTVLPIPASGYDIRMEILGDKGMVQVTNPVASSVVVSTGAGIAGDLLTHSFPERFEVWCFFPTLIPF